MLRYAHSGAREPNFKETMLKTAEITLTSAIAEFLVEYEYPPGKAKGTAVRCPDAGLKRYAGLAASRAKQAAYDEVDKIEEALLTRLALYGAGG